MAICVYAQDCDDFSTNGLSVLTPLSCIVTEEACGMFELEMEHPIDNTLRWAQLAPGCIIKAPVPTRESPLYESEGLSEGTVSGVVTRNVWQVSGTKSGLAMYNKPSGKKKKLTKLKNGVLVNEIERKTVGKTLWLKVIAQNGGRKGWMKGAYLKESGSVQENVWNGQIVEPKGLKREQCREQLFRVYSVERDATAGIVTAKAMHISYDLRATLVNSAYTVEKKTDAKSVLNGVFERLAAEHEFELHIIGDALDKKITGEYGWKNPIECMLDPDEGILAQTEALLLRDNYDLYVVSDRTRDTGVTIRRGKNLKGVSVTQDTSDIVTRIIPCGKNKKGEDLFLVGENYIDSPHIGEYPFPYIQKIDYDVKVVDKDPDKETTFTSVDNARKKLRELAEADFAEHGVDLPTYGMEIDFVLLQNTEAYADYAGLQAVYLGDTVTVIDSLIGLTAKVRVTGYEWDALTMQYNSVTLGDLLDMEQTVYSYNLPTGGVSGSKLAAGSVNGDKLIPGSVDGTVLRDATIEYAKIAIATIEQLNADSIVALTAKIQEIVAGKIVTDELYSALGEFFTLRASEITAGNITTDELAAQLARLQVLIAGTASFDEATIQHLVSQAMNLEFGVAGQVFITNLAVSFAQIISATVGDLVLKASDGNYYRLDVHPDGTVSATRATVTSGEIAAGQTNAGEVILGTNITAANLNTTNFLATYALINQIDAARIDVDQLFAREAFVALLRTCHIIGDKTIEMIAEDAEAGAGAAQDVSDALDGVADAEKSLDVLAQDQHELQTYLRIVAGKGVYIGYVGGGTQAFIDQNGWFAVLNNGQALTAMGPGRYEIGPLAFVQVDAGNVIVMRNDTPYTG